MDIKIVMPAVSKDTPASDGSPRKPDVSKSPVKKLKPKSKPPAITKFSSLPETPPQAPPTITTTVSETPPSQSPPAPAPLSTSAPVPRSSPIPTSSPPVQSPISVSPPSPSSSSPPPVQPKSAKAIARKFEMMELASKKTEPIRSAKKIPGSPRREALPNGEVAANESPLPLSQTPPPAPPPIPTSSRPVLKNRAYSCSTEKKPSSLTRIEPVILAKPIPISASSSEAATAGSASSSSSLKSSTPTSAGPTRSMPTKAQSKVLLTSQNKYQNLLKDRPSSSGGAVRVTSGPNFSFYVS